MKILITGANGFIGSHLTVKLCEEGNEIIVLSRGKNSKNEQFNKYVNEGKIRIIQGDIQTFDITKLEKVDYIYHFAGKVGVFGKYEDFYNINVMGTKHLLDYAKHVGAKGFTYVSSTAVYGVYGYTNLKEDAEKRPFSDPYSQTKLITEELVKKFCTENAIDFVIVRPGNVFGEYDYTSSNEIYSRVKKQKMLISANGKYKSCFVYVKNLVDAIAYVSSNKEYRNEDYNITDGENETLKEYLTLVAKHFNVKAKFTNVPAFLAKTMATVTEFVYKLFRIKKAPLITKFSVWQNCNDYNFSIEKLLSTGFKRKYTLEDGVENTCKWYDKVGYERKN